jgi:glycosyltransferase involved in cell wall biosynthesis
MKPPLRVLAVLLDIGETSMPYNEFVLPLQAGDTQKITLCTFFAAEHALPDGIEVHMGDGTIPGFYRALRSALKQKKHDIIHIHAPHLGAMFLLANPFLGNPLPRAICTVHNSFASYKPRNKLMFLPILAAFPRIVLCSEASFRSLPRFYKALASDRLRVIPNGVNIERIDNVLGRHARQKISTMQVVSVGRLVPIKSPLVTLAAFHQSALRQATLTFVGQGPLEPALHDEGTRLGIDRRVYFTGLISRESVYRRLESADIFVSTSTGEGLPLAVLEAMACRCPVILSDIPSHREIAGNADFIRLIPPNDAEGFACEIRRYARMSQSQRARAGEECRQLVEAKFSLKAMLTAYEKVYLEIVAMSRGTTSSP